MTPLVKHYVSVSDLTKQAHRRSSLALPKSVSALTNSPEPMVATGESDALNIKGGMPKQESEALPISYSELPPELEGGLPPQAENFAKRISEMVRNFRFFVICFDQNRTVEQ